jgi:hypothetical protein
MPSFTERPTGRIFVPTKPNQNMLLPSDIIPDQQKTHRVVVKFSPDDVARLLEVKRALGFRTISEMIRVCVAEGAHVVAKKTRRTIPPL